MEFNRDTYTIAVSWEDNVGQIQYFAPGETDAWFLSVDEYQIEFYSSDGTWRRVDQGSDCYSVRDANSCIQKIEELQEPPFSLSENSLILARVYAENEESRTYRD